MSPGQGWTPRRALGVISAGTALLAGVFMVSVQSFAATAAPSDVGAGDLVVTAHPHPTKYFDMSPGESRYWSIDASLTEAEQGTLALRVFGAGALVDHSKHPLSIAVHGCDGMLVGGDPRVRPACEGAEYVAIIDEQPLAQISSHPVQTETTNVWVLPDIMRDEPRSFVVTLAVPGDGADDKTLMGLRGEFGVGLFASGTDTDAPETPSDDAALAPTGTALPWSLALIGVGTSGLGFVFHRVRARHS